MQNEIPLVMNWNSYTEVSDYLSGLCLICKEKPTFLSAGPDESYLNLLDKVAKTSTVLLDDIEEGSFLTKALYQCETSTIRFFVLSDINFGDKSNMNSTIDKNKYIAKGIIAKIIHDSEDDEYMQVLSSSHKDVVALNGTLYGVMSELVIRGKLLEYDENLWEQ